MCQNIEIQGLRMYLIKESRIEGHDKFMLKNRGVLLCNIYKYYFSRGYVSGESFVLYDLTVKYA